MKRLIPILILMLPISLWAQNTITDDLIIDQIERMVDDTDDEVDYTQLIETYWDICEHKINVNNPEELSQLIELHLVNVFIVENILLYRKNFGDITSFEELKFVEGIDEMTFNIMQPLICFEKPKENEKLKFKDVWKRGKHQAQFQTERCFNKKAGYQDVSDSILYENPNKKYLRYSLSGLPRYFLLGFLYNIESLTS